MLTCLKCLKVTEPEVIVIERADRYPLCDKCGVSMVELVERMPLEVVPEEAPDPPVDEGEITEVKEKPKAKAKKKKSK